MTVAAPGVDCDRVFVAFRLREWLVTVDAGTEPAVVNLAPPEVFWLLRTERDHPTGVDVEVPSPVHHLQLFAGPTGSGAEELCSGEELGFWQGWDDLRARHTSVDHDVHLTLDGEAVVQVPEVVAGQETSGTLAHLGVAGENVVQVGSRVGLARGLPDCFVAHPARVLLLVIPIHENDFVVVVAHEVGHDGEDAVVVRPLVDQIADKDDPVTGLQLARVQ